MVRLVLISAAFASGLMASVALADDDVMAGFYGNTSIATGGMADTHTNYSADHTFVMKVPSFGVSFKGTWAVNAGTLCRTFDSPPPGVTNPLCTQIEAHKVGDTWTTDGRTITLVKGIQ
jgi:hypothetical protein